MKKKNSVGVANVAYVESEAGSAAKKSTTTTTTTVTAVKPMHIIEEALPAESDSNCGYFGLRCPGQRHCLSAVGVLIFLCWASTIQVSNWLALAFR